MTSTPLFYRYSDQETRDERDAELAAREEAEHLEAAVACECCGARLTADRKMVDGFVVGVCCQRRLAAAFLPEILAAAGETRWGGQA